MHRHFFKNFCLGGGRPSGCEDRAYDRGNKAEKTCGNCSSALPQVFIDYAAGAAAGPGRVRGVSVRSRKKYV